MGSFRQLFWIVLSGQKKNKNQQKEYLPPKMIKPPPIKTPLWSLVKSEKTKKKFLDFGHYMELSYTVWRHLRLWEGSIPLGEAYSLLGRLCRSGRHIPL